VVPAALFERLRALLRVAGARRYRGRRGLGQRWEGLAERRLAAAGYVIRERNYRSRGPRGFSGEIDLIAEDSGTLCFVEVKGRRGPGFGAPAEAVTLEKQRRIARAAQEYVWRRRLPPSTRCRFDVVSVVDAGRGEPRVEILRDAFPLTEGPRPRR
jgi:putative endonuclease